MLRHRFSAYIFPALLVFSLLVGGFISAWHVAEAKLSHSHQEDSCGVCSAASIFHASAGPAPVQVMPPSFDIVPALISLPKLDVYITQLGVHRVRSHSPPSV